MHSLLKQVKQKLDPILDSSDQKYAAAFDADGTCWSSDVGRDFFAYEVESQKFKSDLISWKKFNEIEKNKSIEEALWWVCEVHDGFDEQEVLTWASEALEVYPPKVIEPVHEVIRYLNEKNVDVYIVTASVKWAIVPAASLVSIKPENIIGVETKVVGGTITSERLPPLTWDQGKPEALKKHTGSTPLIFAAGNSFADYPLLKSSTGLKLAVHKSPTDSSLEISERKLQEKAKTNNWLRLSQSPSAL